MIWKLLSLFSGVPIVQLKCKHPDYARDARMTLLPEENGMDFYEVCLNCDREWHEKASRRKSR